MVNEVSKKLLKEETRRDEGEVFAKSIWLKRPKPKWRNSKEGKQGVRLALGPFRHPKPGMAPFWAPFLVGMGPFGRSWRSKFRCGSQISSLFLGLGPPFSG